MGNEIQTIEDAIIYLNGWILDATDDDNEADKTAYEAWQIIRLALKTDDQLNV